MMKLPCSAFDKYREDGHLEQEIISLGKIRGSSGRISKCKYPTDKIKETEMHIPEIGFAVIYTPLLEKPIYTKLQILILNMKR